MGEGVGRLGGREAQSAMMRWGSFFTSGGQGVRGILQSPHLPLWPSQSLSPSSFQKPPLPWPVPLQLPRAQAGRLETQGMAPCLTLSKLGGWPMCGRGGQAAGSSGAFGSCAAGVLTPVTPETPLPPQKSQEAVESPYSLPLYPYFCWGLTVLGRSALVGWWSLASTALPWRAEWVGELG